MGQSSDSLLAYGSAPLQDPLLGQIIAEKYQIERLVGRGGMGTVYEGKHLLLERHVAIKVMQVEMAEDERTAARFLREAKTAARLEHPNAVTIHDFGVLQEKIAYIVMEYIRGRTLRQWLNQHGKCEPEKTVVWLSQACDAVAAAHEQGIIHRDLKPENIMLKEAAGSESVVKVVDFGLAKLVSGDESSGFRITRTSEVIGTPYYMAPEFYQGEEIDKRADIYALGIIAYEMLKGQAPFTGTIEAIIGGHLFKEPAPLHHTNSKIPKTVCDVVARALSKDRDERFDTAGQFAEALKLAIRSPIRPKSSETAVAEKDSDPVIFNQEQPKETIPTLVSIDACEVTKDEIARLSNQDRLRETIPTLESFELEDPAESQKTLIYSSDQPLLPTEKASRRKSIDRQPGSPGRRFLLTTALVVVAFMGLGAGTAFWLGSKSPAATVPQPAPTETAAPQPAQPAGNDHPAVVIQENQEQDEAQTKEPAEKNQQATTTNTARKTRAQAQKSSVGAKSSKLPDQQGTESTEEAKKEKDKKNQKKKGIFGRIKGVFVGD